VPYGLGVPATKPRLTAEDWARAALEAIAVGGVSAVSVEALAPRVGASKGSFYWHYPDRAALVRAAVELWDRLSQEASAEIATIQDPLQRLRYTLALGWGNPQAGRLEAALSRPDVPPGVRPILRRITERRIEVATQIFRDLGFPEDEARQRALLAYTSYIGFFAVAQMAPAAVPVPGSALDRYLDRHLELLTRN
jgi:AcrR family transcriptional regulator